MLVSLQHSSSLKHWGLVYGGTTFTFNNPYAFIDPYCIKSHSDVLDSSRDVYAQYFGGAGYAVAAGYAGAVGYDALEVAVVLKSNSGSAATCMCVSCVATAGDTTTGT